MFRQLMIILVIFIVFGSVYAHDPNVISGTLKILDKNNGVVLTANVTELLGETPNTQDILSQLDGFNIYHIYVTQTPLPENYYNILMVLMAPNPYVHDDIVDMLNKILSGNVSEYYIYVPSNDYNSVMIYHIMVNNTYVPNINQVRIKQLNPIYDELEKLGVLVRWVHTIKISNRVNSISENYAVSSIITDGKLLYRFITFKPSDLIVYRITDVEYYYLQTPQTSSTNIVDSIYQILPDLRNGKVVYLYYKINDLESIYVEIVPTNAINPSLYHKLNDIGSLSNISVWGYGFSGDANYDSNYNGHVVTEHLVDNVFHSQWLGFIMDFATFPAKKVLNITEFREVGYSLTYEEFTDTVSIDYLINETYNNGIVFLGLSKQLSDGTYFTLKYALEYVNDTTFKVLLVKYYNASTENDAFLVTSNVHTVYSFAPILYEYKNNIDHIEIYDNNDNLAQYIDRTSINNPNVDINVIESLLEDIFYDNPNYKKMKVYLSTIPIQLITIERDTNTNFNTTLIVYEDTIAYNWTNNVKRGFRRYGNLTISEFVNVSGDAFTNYNGWYGANFVFPINYSTFKQYSDGSATQSYLNSTHPTTGYTLSAFLGKLDRILMTSYDIGFYTYSERVIGFWFFRTIFLHEYMTYTNMNKIYLRDTSTDLTLETHNIYVNVYGYMQLILKSQLYYNITVQDIKIYDGNTNQEIQGALIGIYNNTIIPARGTYIITLNGFKLMNHGDTILTLDAFYKTKIQDLLDLKIVIDGTDPNGDQITLTLTTKIALNYVA